jgi:hypothetical protein
VQRDPHRLVRPPDSASNVVTALIVTAGGRNVTPVTIVPSRIRSVRVARNPSVVWHSSIGWPGEWRGSAWIR